MTNKVETDDRSYLIKAVLPEATDSYTVIPHELIINTLESVLQKKDFSIVKEVYKYNMNAQIAYGVYHLNIGDDPDVGMMFAWVNSYNKQVKFRCTVGGFTRISEAILIAENENSSFVRKHTGTADTEVEASIKGQLERAYEHYKQIVDDKNAMKEIIVERKEFSNLLGEMYILDKKISSEQLNISVREFWKPTYGYGDKLTLWVAYNHILQGVLKCHPGKWMAQQKAIHTYIVAKYNIGMEQSENPSKEEITRANEFLKEIVETPIEEKEGVVEDNVTGANREQDTIYKEEVAKSIVEQNKSDEITQSDIEADAKIKEESKLEEKAEEEAENLVEVNGQKIHVKTALDQKHHEGAETPKEEPKFMTMGKLGEASPGFYKGFIINIEGQYYEIGDPTVSGGLPGHWLIAIDKPSEPIILQGGVAEEEVVEEIVVEEEVISEEIIEDEDDEFNIEQPVIAIVEEELKEEQPELRPESEAPKKMGFLPPQQGTAPVKEEEEIVSREPKATEEVIEALSKSETKLPVEGEVFEDEGDEETAEAIRVSKEKVPSVWKEMDTPAKPAEVKTKIEPAGPILDQKDIKIIPPEGQEDPARQIIQKHLHELYGEIKEFTFKVTDDQYNIVLTSKETICLTKKFIQQEIAESLNEI